MSEVTNGNHLTIVFSELNNDHSCWRIVCWRFFGFFEWHFDKNQCKVIDPSTVEDQMLFVGEIDMWWHILSKPSAPDQDVFKMIDMEVRIVYSTVIMLIINTTYYNLCIDRWCRRCPSIIADEASIWIVCEWCDSSFGIIRSI